MKITRACDKCRKRKVKCDGVQPCSQCRKSETQCVFAKQPPKRGPPTQYIELLEQRLQLVERALRNIDGPARQILDAALAQDSNGTHEESLDTTIQENNNPGSAASCASSPAIMDQFSIDYIGQALYVNDLKPGMDGTQNASTFTDSQSEDSLDSPVQRLHVAQSDVSNCETLYGLGDVPLSLIETYFAHVHNYAPMVHKPTFWKQIRSQIGAPSKLLLFAMCAVASRWIENNSTNVPPGFSFYQRAFALIDEYSDAPRVSTIQALVLLTKYQEYYRRLGFFCRPGLYLSIAVRMCHDLGLPQLNSTSVSGSSELESMKRTFWMTFVYDLLISIEQGREPYFANIECTTEYPLATEDEGPALEELLSNHNAMIQLSKTLANVYKMSRRVAQRQQTQSNYRSVEQVVEEQSRLFVLHTHLETIIHELPPSLTYPPTLDMVYPVEKQAPPDVFVGFLHMMYHFTMILLHRHYVLYPLPETNVTMKTYPHHNLCVASASNITTIAESMMENMPVDVFSYPTRGVQYTIHCVATAATVHRHEMNKAQDKASNDFAQTQYLRSLKILNRLALESPAVEFHSYMKEAELAQMYGQMAMETTTLPPNVPSTPSVASSGDLSSTSSSPDAFKRAIKVPKSRRHTLTCTPKRSQQVLLNSSASLTDPTRFANMMHNSTFQALPQYNHHQQPLLLAPNTRRSPQGLHHHWSHSQEDLRALRRNHMNNAPFPPQSWTSSRTLHKSSSMQFTHAHTPNTMKRPSSSPTALQQQLQQQQQQQQQQRRHTISEHTFLFSEPELQSPVYVETPKDPMMMMMLDTPISTATAMDEETSMDQLFF
ncbi:hypothetical protein DFQ28_001351 [Apophysomyces sp. BC1034]|nr:hypothetical protein DFQ28_001351 [Apophysomyces sp. BC1034]